MYVPMWLVWVLVGLLALPVVYFATVFLLFLGASGEHALKRDAEEARESADK
jgi:hypothetical protein